MATLILQTKLYVPSARVRDGSAQHVHRQQLIARLNAGIARKLTLVCAPAGFGKSTLLSAWAHQAAPHRVAWFSLDESDNDPVRFWTHFVAALQTTGRASDTDDADRAEGEGNALGATTAMLLQSPQLLPVETLLTPLLNDLARDADLTPATPSLTVILDDYHVVDNSVVHQGVRFLLDRLPPQLHIIISSRADPPWPLARLRGQDQLTELRTDDLRFTSEEAVSFLQEKMQLELSAAEIHALDTRTEGWIAGLQLVGLSLRGATDPARFITAFSGTNRYIVDYLVEEVLAHQSEAIQHFLLQTSILERLCGALCDAVVEIAGDVAGNAGSTLIQNGQAMLEQLDHDNLFLIALDNERNWYRYHHLFSEVLQHRLRRSYAHLIPTLHQRASRWFQQQDLIAEAIHHALAAGDFDGAAALIERIGIAHFAQPQVQYALTRWIATLPVSLINRRPRLCLIHSLILFVNVDVPAALQRVEDAEAANRAAANLGDPVADELVGGEIAAMRALVVAYHPDFTPQTTLATSAAALTQLRDTQPAFQSIVGLALGLAHLRLGALAAAEQALATAAYHSRAADNQYLAATATSHQIAMQRARGQLHHALATCQEAWTWAILREQREYPAYEGTAMNFAELYRESNELDRAQQYAEQAVARSNQADKVSDPSMFLISRLVLLRVKQAQQDWPAAWTLLEQIDERRSQHPTVIHADLLPALRAQLYLTQAANQAANFMGNGDALVAAWAWAKDATWEEGDLVAAARFFEYIYIYEHRRMARVQVFIAWARAFGTREILHDALAYLQRQYAIAEAAGALGYQIKILLLEALARDLLGEAAPSRDALTRALRLAQPQGYVRTFIDEGEPLRRLLIVARATFDEVLLSAYGDRLLASFAPPPPQIPAPQPPASTTPTALYTLAPDVAPMVEQLTERELEIMRLVHDGLSNRELAAKLIVSIGTIKKHLNNIFGKLGVSSRTQAIARARALELL